MICFHGGVSYLIMYFTKGVGGLRERESVRESERVCVE